MSTKEQEVKLICYCRIKPEYIIIILQVKILINSYIPNLKVPSLYTFEFKVGIKKGLRVCLKPTLRENGMKGLQ